MKNDRRLHNKCSEVNKESPCIACQKNVVVKPDSILAVCSSCNLKQTQSLHHVQWMLRVVVKPSDEATKPSSLGTLPIRK